MHKPLVWHLTESISTVSRPVLLLSCIPQRLCWSSHLRPKPKATAPASSRRQVMRRYRPRKLPSKLSALARGYEDAPTRGYIEPRPQKSAAETPSKKHSGARAEKHRPSLPLPLQSLISGTTTILAELSVSHARGATCTQGPPTTTTQPTLNRR